MVHNKSSDWLLIPDIITQENMKVTWSLISIPNIVQTTEFNGGNKGRKVWWMRGGGGESEGGEGWKDMKQEGKEGEGTEN